MPGQPTAPIDTRVRPARRPDRDALIRLLGAVLAEQHDEWIEGRRYLGIDVLTRCRIRPVTDPATTTEEVPTHTSTAALSA